MRRSFLAVRSLTNASDLPSGEYAGSASRAIDAISACWSDPSAFIAHTSRLPDSVRSVSNAIVRPSGDQAGFSLVRTAAVSACWFDPSAFITHTWREPERALVKASCRPSGDQAGSPSKPADVVSRVVPVPSFATTKTSPLWSFRFDSNAIFEPSGDHAGSPSCPTEYVISFEPLPSAFTVQRSESPLRTD